MKILLINPPNSHELIANDPVIVKDQQGLYPPLGLLHLASHLQKKHKVRIVDCQTDCNSVGDIAEAIVLFKPDVIGMTVMTFTLIDCLEAMKTIREFSDAVVVLGGPHPTIYPAETLVTFGCDFVIQGEGEIAFEKLLENLTSKNRVWREDSFIEDLDTLHYPARELTPYKLYYSVLAEETPTTTMFSSRGCPFQCTYCDRPALGKRFRSMSADRTVDEMEHCQCLGIKEIFFYDDTFTVNKRRVMDICWLIVDRGLKITWDVRARVDTVDEEMIIAMKEAGCVRIHFGVESAQPHILKALNKGITREQVTNAFKWCKKHGIKTLAYFMIGNPGETSEDIDETLRFAKELNPDYMQCTILTPFPATKLYRNALARGFYGDVWREYAINPTPEFQAPIWPENFTREQLQKKLKSFYRGFYLRPMFLLKAILEIRNLAQLKRYFKAGLSLLKMR